VLTSLKLFYKNLSEFLKIIYFSLSWGILSFIFHFIFYLYSPSITERYLCDFSASIAAIIMAFFFLIIYWLSSIKTINNNGRILIPFLILACILFYFEKMPFVFNNNRPAQGNVTRQDINIKLCQFKEGTFSNYALPEKLTCPAYYPPGLTYQFTGWNFNSNCMVDISTTLYFPAKQCITINYSIPNSEKWLSLLIKRDFVLLKLINSQIITNSLSGSQKEEITQEFCSDSPPSNNISMFTIGWATVDKLSWDLMPITLNWAKVEGATEKK